MCYNGFFYIPMGVVLRKFLNYRPLDENQKKYMIDLWTYFHAFKQHGKVVFAMHAINPMLDDSYSKSHVNEFFTEELSTFFTEHLLWRRLNNLPKEDFCSELFKKFGVNGIVHEDVQAISRDYVAIMNVKQADPDCPAALKKFIRDILTQLHIFPEFHSIPLNEPNGILLFWRLHLIHYAGHDLTTEVVARFQKKITREVSSGTYQVFSAMEQQLQGFVVHMAPTIPRYSLWCNAFNAFFAPFTAPAASENPPETLKNR